MTLGIDSPISTTKTRYVNDAAELLQDGQGEASLAQLVTNGPERWRKEALDTLSETNSSPLKMDGWNTSLLLG